jgi:hypothetical protein
MDANTQGQVTQQQPQDQDSAGGDATPRKLYATHAEAEAARPADATKSLKPFEVLHNGTSKGWVLARGYDNALSIIARLDGYSASTGTRAATVTKEVVAAKVMEMTDEEWKALVAARKAAEKAVR